jgi:hypothetical protein
MENIIPQNEQIVKYCLECGSQMQQFFLPLYNYENKFCEQCEIEDYEGKCHSS